jgi:nucleoside-diphosphate-sugar epimerase
MNDTLQNRKIMVTGGTGFIGGRLIERLIEEHNARITVLVSNINNLARIARYPIEIVKGNILNYNDVFNAAEGCDYIFHCAYAPRGDFKYQKNVTLQGLKNILDISRRLNPSRVVYLSTMMVYDLNNGKEVDERSKKKYTGYVYSDSKLKSEKLAARYYNKFAVPITILQPTVVYGPYGPAWTTKIIDRLKTKKVILVNGGYGICNCVYIDDLIDAMFNAAVAPGAPGESFLISGPDHITWRDFYKEFEEIISGDSTVEMSAEEAESFFHSKVKKRTLLSYGIGKLKTFLKKFKNTYEINALLRIVNPLLSKRNERSKTKDKAETPKLGNTDNDKPILPIDRNSIDFFRSTSVIKIDKAKKILNYNPKITFDEGIRLTKKWVQWSNILNN